MKPWLLLATFWLAILPAGPALAQIYDTNNIEVHTFAGYGFAGYVDGQGLYSAFSAPSQIAADAAGNLYVLDNGNARIRKVTPNGTVSTLVGGGLNYEGFGTNVSLAWGALGSMTADRTGNLWLVLAPNSYSGNTAFLISITTNGYVTLQTAGLTNLTVTSGLGFDSANNLYYSGGNRIYRYTPTTGQLQPFAGNGLPGNFDGQGTVFDEFNTPTALACDPANNLYVWDSGNATIRRVDQNQNVTTLAGNSANYYYGNQDGSGTNATFSGVNSLFTDTSGNLYLVSNSSIRKMDAQTNVDTLAGNFNQYSGGFADGPGSQAKFNNALGGCLVQGTLYIADAGNNRIRSLTMNAPAQNVAPASLQLNTYPGLQITGTPGRTYQIQTSPDLKAWATSATLVLPSSPYFWVDQNPVAGSKYYRAVMLP